jgi:hypothetical protein
MEWNLGLGGTLLAAERTLVVTALLLLQLADRFLLNVQADMSSTIDPLNKVRPYLDGSWPKVALKVRQLSRKLHVELGHISEKKKRRRRQDEEDERERNEKKRYDHF